MKKNLLALSVAVAVGTFAATANADVVIGTDTGGAGTGTLATPMGVFPTELGATDATALRFTPDGIGHVLLVPYYTVQQGNSTLINIVNTDSNNGKAVKVRFRGALNSDDVFDFTLFLSPNDVWTANISQGADGRATLTTTDNSCTLPANVSQAFVTDRLPGDAAAKAAGTREGYIEIFNMADIEPVVIGGATESIYEATKHNASGAVTCTASVLAPLANNLTTEPAAAGLGFQAPSTGLMANWIIINVPEASAWAGSAAAVVAESALGVPGLGRFVLHPQTDGVATITANNTADPLLRSTLVGGAFFDLPDVSTPYLTVAALAPVGGGGEADRQAVLMTEALSIQSISNEYLTDPTIAGKTSWVFSLPTRRYALGVNYAGTTPATRLVFNEFVHNVVGAGAGAPADYVAGAFFGAAATGGRFINGATAYAAPAAGTNIVLTGDAACVRLAADAVSAWNRSEVGLTGSGFVISPGTATTLEFCGETTVLGFNGTTALNAAIATKDVDVGAFVDGWARIATPGLGGQGLPVLGQSFVKATNPGVAGGTSGNFGASWDHRFTR